MEIKFLKKGIRVNGDYYACHYSPSRNNINGNATVYLRGYKRLPQEAHSFLKIENDTEIITDYIEKDRIRIAPTSPYFEQVERLANVSYV